MRLIPLFPVFLMLTGAAAPQRIVSLNLCADQYLIALADRGQIAALTQLARDPAMSAAANEAGSFPTIRGSNEDVLALRPDLVIAMPGRLQGAMARLPGRGVATIELAPANSYAEIVAQVRAIAAAVGRPARGEALIARMNAALARIPRNAGRGATAAYYQRRGYLTGGGTLVDDLMHRLGLRNLATRVGKPVLARVGLEELALARPDWLIVESNAADAPDRGAEMLHHPLIAQIPRLSVPQAWTVCGGPAYVRAAQALSAQLGAKEHRP